MSEQVHVHHKSDSFAKVPYELITDKRISDGAVRQYAYMHWRYGSSQDNHEGRASIARSMGVSEATVSKRIAELEAAGWVVVIERRQPDTNEQATNAYHVFEVAGDAKEFREKFQPRELEIMRIAPPMPDRKGRTGIGGRPKKTQVNMDPDKLEFTHVGNSSLQELDAVDLDAKDSLAESTPEPPTPSKPKTPHQLMYDAIVTAFNWTGALNDNERGLANRANKLLRQSEVQPCEVPALYAWCKAQGWPGGFSPLAMANHVQEWRNSLHVQAQPIRVITSNGAASGAEISAALEATRRQLCQPVSA